jgi:hypothetical protein
LPNRKMRHRGRNAKEQNLSLAVSQAHEIREVLC